MHDGGQQRADRPRQRVRRALERAVRVEQPRHPQPAAGRARGEQGERAVEQLAVRVEEDGDGMLRPLDAHVVGRPEPRVVPELDDLGPGRPRERRALVGRRGVHDDQLRRGGEPPERGEQRRERPGRVVEHDDDGERGHAASASTARVRRAVSAQVSGAILAWPAASRRRAERRVALEREQRVGERPGVPGRHVQRALAQHLAEHREVGDDRGRAGCQALDRREPEALEPRRQHDRQRAGVERAEVVDPPEPPHPRPARVEPALPDDHELGREPARPGAEEGVDQEVRRLARLEGADEQERGARALRRREPPRGQRHGVDAVGGQAPRADQVFAPHLGVGQHPRGSAGEAAGAGGGVPGALVGREVARPLLPRAVVDGEHERRVADRQWSGRGGPEDVGAGQEGGEARAAGHRRGAEQRAGGEGVADRHDPARDRRSPARQQHAVLVVRERRGEGFEQGARIVRDPACPAADQAAPVDPDPHACCPVNASPSTPAPPRDLSSAGSSAGRASSRPGCRSSATTRSSRRARGSSTAPATRGSSSCCRPAPRTPGRCCARPTSRRSRTRAT